MKDVKRAGSESRESSLHGEDRNESGHHRKTRDEAKVLEGRPGGTGCGNKSREVKGRMRLNPQMKTKE
jgi:hypothetical protein